MLRAWDTGRAETGQALCLRKLTKQEQSVQNRVCNQAVWIQISAPHLLPRSLVWPQFPPL